MIAFTCASCAKKLAIPDDLAGKQVKCPGCGKVTQAPKQAVVSPAAVSRPQVAQPVPAPRPPSLDEPNPEASLPDRPTAPPSLLDATRPPNPAPEHDPSLTAFLAPARADDELGRLGDFRILKILGHGGMGVVFQGEDPRLGRKVAIKAMLPHLAGSQSAQQRFLREARAAAALEHDHIVPIFHVGEDRGAPFIVMPFLKGESLDARLRREKKLPTAEVLRIGREMAEGLAAAHAQGLVHRDIKPANVWLEDCTSSGRAGHVPARVKILDFGLARAASKDSGLTQEGAIIGTPAYMAPEQGRGETVDARCDLWSLGVVLYRMCTGRQPFHGPDMVATLMAVAMDNPPAPATINRETPAGLSDLVMRLLEKTPAKRIATAHQVVAAIQALERLLARREATEILPAAVAVAVPVAAVPSPFADLDQPTQGIVGQPTRSAKAASRHEDATLTLDNQASRDGSAPAKRSRKPLWLALTGVLAAILCGILIVRSRPRGGEKKPEVAAQVNSNRKKAEVKEPLPKTITNSIGMKLVLIPAGKFTMGSPQSEKDRGTDEQQHEVEITKAFYLGVHPVTQEQYQQVTGNNPSWFSATGAAKDLVRGLDTRSFPVEQVSWEDAQTFLKKLSARPQEKEQGRTYRLPTEAEREYACRGGSPSYQVFHFGNSLSSRQANFNGNDPYGETEKGPYLSRTCPVGSYLANAWGLCDMHGNVWEWCQDWYGEDYYSKSPREDPSGPAEGTHRVRRGGSWFDFGTYCRSAYRSRYTPKDRSGYLGFRVALGSVSR